MIKFLVPVALVLVASAASASWSTQIVDEDGKGIEKIAETICSVTDGYDKQIGQLATVGKLVEFLQTLPEDHKLAGCRQQYGESLERLQELLVASSENVCSDGAISSIEQFHRRYISTVKKHKKEQEVNNWRAPRLIKIFFMHYVSRVSSICESNAAHILKQIETNKAGSGNDEASDSIARFVNVLGATDLKHGYDHVYLMWNVIARTPVSQSEKYSKYIDEDADIKMRINMKDAEGVKSMQQLCRSKLAPIYSKTLLPVIRLVDLGYLPMGDALVTQVSEGSVSKKLFHFVQVCETIKPIAVFADNSLATGQIVLLPKDYNNQAAETQFEKSTDAGSNQRTIEPHDNSLPLDTKLASVTKDSAKQAAKAIKKSIRKREKSLKTILKKLVYNLKGQVDSKIGSIFMSSDNQQLQPAVSEEDLAPIVEEEASQLYEDSNAAEDEEGALVRRKRAPVAHMIGKGMKNLAIKVAYGIWFIVSRAVALAILVVYLALVVVVLIIDVIRAFIAEMTGYNIKWIEKGSLAFVQPLIDGFNKAKEKASQH